MEREIVTFRIRLMIKYLNRLRGAKSSGMRNRLVHQYEAIDNELVFKAIPIALSQFPLYLKQITDYLDSLEVKDA